MKKHICVLFLCAMSLMSSAQEVDSDKTEQYAENVKTLDAIIKSLYTVISDNESIKRDWAFFKFLFKPDAKLIPSGKNNDGELMVSYMKPADYIKSSGKWLTENNFTEKEIHRKVDLFGNLAHVFSTYEAYKHDSGDTPFMRGINSIQLLNDGERWWIINIYWTQETELNPIPKKYL